MGNGLVRVQRSAETAPERTASAGRHRRGAEAVVLAVRARRVTRHRRPEVSPNDRPPLDAAGRDGRESALSDTGSVGLRMFDLGAIPASVTPPRTSRRAAWFTIVASAAALLGLLAVGTMLVGPMRTSDRFDAMPDFPSGAPLAAIGGSASVRPVSASLRPATSTVVVGGDTVRLTPRRHAGRPTTGGGPTAPVVATLPAAVTVPGGEPVIDPTKLLKQTRTFFAQVTSNAQAAADLTDRTVRDDAAALIRQKYGDVSTIQIQSITLDPSDGLTVSLLRVVNKDGTTSTERTTLHFTLTADPKITNPGG
jgi:hypothetical protein